MTNVDVTEGTLLTMEKFGGSFVRQLAILYRLGDYDNKKKLIDTFEDYFKKYLSMSKMV